MTLVLEGAPGTFEAFFRKYLMRDKYAKAIKYLTAHPDELYVAWCVADDRHPAGCLFQWAWRGDTNMGGVANVCGCITHIRNPHLNRIVFAYSETLRDRLTKEIREDERIPTRGDLIKISDLPVFAEWQRRLDKELLREIEDLRQGQQNG